MEARTSLDDDDSWDPKSWEVRDEDELICGFLLFSIFLNFVFGIFEFN